jgi:hypothetical protein
MRIIIAGTRTFNDFEFLKSEMAKFRASLQKESPLEVVSGCAKGADTLGESWASQEGLKIHRYPADWNKNGKAAGPLRNVQMADNAEACVIFWDGKSSGSKHMIATAIAKGLITKVVRYEV